MKSIISTTYDDTYLYYLPITTWCWNKLGVDVICFMPDINVVESERSVDWMAAASKLSLIHETCRKISLNLTHPYFKCPKQKEATYAQCSRLFGACLDLPEDEILITSDIDMLVFGEYLKSKTGSFDIFGSDLTPNAQYPMCYISASVHHWRAAMSINKRTYQECLDDLVGAIECEHFKGNQWGLDQDTAFKMIGRYPITAIDHHQRARLGTQFASKRIDRDDAFFTDRISPDIIDYHMHRPGYADENFEKILSVISYFYPDEDLTWMREYQTEYKKLL